jgi:hypothetical protein
MLMYSCLSKKTGKWPSQLKKKSVKDIDNFQCDEIYFPTTLDTAISKAWFAQAFKQTIMLAILKKLIA